MSKNLIIYYSRKGQNYVNGRIESLTKGNTEICAEFIQKAVGGDLFEVETVNGYKVLISKTSAEHAGEPGKDGTFRVLTSSIKVIGPKEVCTLSYFIIGNYQE